MKKIFIISIISLLFEISLFGQNDFTSTYVDLGHQSAALYQPVNKTEKARTAVIVMHSHQDYMNFIANRELAKRGYTVLATIPGSEDTLESKILKIKACVDYLNSRDDINNIVLLGHSGGATVMTAYQYLAENGRDGLEGKLYQDYSSKIEIGRAHV